MYPPLLTQGQPPAPSAMQPQSQAGGAPQPTPTMQPQYNMPNAYAHGGRPKRGKMVMAHMNGKELDILDHLQGKTERCPRSGMRSYSHLEELLKNPHILSSVHQHAGKYQGGHAEHHAAGGPAGHEQYASGGLNHLAADGVHGDHELALIGPHTHHVFNRLATGGTTNPHDGLPQYWSLGGALGGLWDTLKGGANTAWNGIKSAAPYIGKAGSAILPYIQKPLEEAAEKRFGPLGGMAASGLGSLAGEGFGALSHMGESSPQGQGAASAIGQGIGTGIQARMGGATPGQSFGQGLAKTGSRFGNGVGGALQGVGGALGAGKGLRDTAMAGARGGYEGAGGADAIKNAAMGMIGQHQAGVSPRDNLGGMASRGMAGIAPTHESMANQDAFEQMPFSGGY